MKKEKRLDGMKNDNQSEEGRIKERRRGMIIGWERGRHISCDVPGEGGTFLLTNRRQHTPTAERGGGRRGMERKAG